MNDWRNPLLVDAFELFQYFFSGEQLQVIADNTNKNARKLRQPWRPKEEVVDSDFAPPFYAALLDEITIEKGGGETWVDTTINELYAFFAIHISMGYCRSSQLKDYWNVEVFRLAYFGIVEAMSMKRFKSLNKYFCPFDPDIDGNDHQKVHLPS